MELEQKLRVKKWIAPCLMVILVIVAVLPRPVAALPPRPEGNRDAYQSGSDGHGDGSGAGAFIELHIQSAQPGGWAAVQWLDNSGNWIDVEGWSGVIEENKPVVWWVKEADFGKGPFRWAVYTDSRKTQMLASDEFYLPRQVGETLPVRISVHPTPTPSPSPTPIQVLTVETIPAPVAVNVTQQFQEGFTTTTHFPTLEAAPSPTSSPAPEPGPTFTPTLTPSPGPATVPPVPTSTPLPPAASNRFEVEVVLPTPASSLQADPVTEGSVQGPMAGDSLLWLSVTQFVLPAAAPGQVITWTFSVRNPTSFAAQEILFGDVLPADLVYLGARTSQGSIELIGDPEIVLVKLGSIPAGRQAEFDIFTKVPAGIEPGKIYNNFATYSSYNFGADVSNVAKVMVNEEGGGGGFLSPATVLGKGVWGSAILVFGTLILMGLKRVRNRSQTRRQEQLP